MHNTAGDVFHESATENRGILDGGAIERRDPKNTFTIHENKMRFCKQNTIFCKENLNCG